MTDCLASVREYELRDLLKQLYKAAVVLVDYGYEDCTVSVSDRADILGAVLKAAAYLHKLLGETAQAGIEEWNELMIERGTRRDKPDAGVISPPTDCQ